MEQAWLPRTGKIPAKKSAQIARTTNHVPTARSIQPPQRFTCGAFPLIRVICRFPQPRDHSRAHRSFSDPDITAYPPRSSAENWKAE